MADDSTNPGTGGRTPDAILDDFAAGCRGLADIDMFGVLHEVIADVIDSGVLYLRTMVSENQAEAFRAAMEDYVGNHYGDD